MTNSRLLLQQGALAAVFASTAVAYIWYHRRSTESTKKQRNRSLGSNQELDPDVIHAFVTTTYDIKIVNCERIKAGVNHNYMVETTDGTKYFLRVYLNDKYYIREADEYRFELELMNYLQQQGGPVVGVIPVAGEGGDLLSVLHLNEEGDLTSYDASEEEPPSPYSRYAALLEWAPGREVSQLNRQSKGRFMGPTQFQALGVLMAQIHQAADSFPNPNNRPRYHQETYLLDQPLQQLVTWGLAGQLDFFRPTAKLIRAKLQQLPRTQPAYGIIHGDFHSANLFCVLQTKQFVAIDWDHCGYGWRVYEFAWLSKLIPGANFEALLRGYESVRKLSAKERELIPVFALLRELWDMGDVLALAPLGVSRPSRAQMNRYLERLRYIQKQMDEIEKKRNAASEVAAVPPYPNPAPAPAPMPAPSPAPAPKAP